MANRYASILANPLARAILASDETTIARERRMYLLVDTTNCQALARHSSMRALQALHYIQFANVDAVIIPEGANKGWAQLDRDCIVSVLANAGYRGRYPEAYNECIKLARQWTEQLDSYIVPAPLELLDAQAHSIRPQDNTPARFDPHGTTPVAVTAWSCPPNRLAQRCDSTFALEFSAGTAGVIPRVPLPPASSSGKVQARSDVHASASPINQKEDHQMATAKKAAAKKPAAKSAKKKGK